MTSPLFHVILGGFALHQIARVGVSQSIDLKLNSREVTVELFQPMWLRYLKFTDKCNVSAVRCHLRSLILVSIESAYVTFY